VFAVQIGGRRDEPFAPQRATLVKRNAAVTRLRRGNVGIAAARS